MTEYDESLPRGVYAALGSLGWRLPLSEEEADAALAWLEKEKPEIPQEAYDRLYSELVRIRELRYDPKNAKLEPDQDPDLSL